ncbi:MAG: hypothetical protein R3195_18625 [Gemmatimonadota bacterium]|nr:hypothetical protein [Gemmatimonadota bacterium]
MSLYEELRKRHVLEVALLYLGVAWLFIEITQFVVGQYGFSPKVLDTVFLIAALGFPAFLVIAWYHGERGPQRVRRGEMSLLLTLGVLAAIGTYRIATGEETGGPASTDDQVTQPGDGRSLANAPNAGADLGDRSLAVLPFRNNVSDEELAWLGPGLADLLTTNFAQVEALRVVGRQTLYDLLTEEGRTENEEIPDALASTVARAAGAHLMLWGTISGTPDDLVIDAQLIELENGTVLAGERVRGSDVFVMVDSLTARLTREVTGGRRGPPRMAISQFGTRDLEALGMFQQGIASERAGRRDEADEYFLRAAEKDTTFMLPAIRLAGGGARGRPPEIPEDVDLEALAEVDDIDDIDFDDPDWEYRWETWSEDVDWAELSPDEREALLAAERARAERQAIVAEAHKERAMRWLEQSGVLAQGEALLGDLDDASREELILKLDSTLAATLSHVRIITSGNVTRAITAAEAAAARDTGGGR